MEGRYGWPRPLIVHGKAPTNHGAGPGRHFTRKTGDFRTARVLNENVCWMRTNDEKEKTMD